MIGLKKICTVIWSCKALTGKIPACNPNVCLSRFLEIIISKNDNQIQKYLSYRPTILASMRASLILAITASMRVNILITAISAGIEFCGRWYESFILIPAAGKRIKRAGMREGRYERGPVWERAGMRIGRYENWPVWERSGTRKGRYERGPVREVSNFAFLTPAGRYERYHYIRVMP